MAVDESLMESARSGLTTLRLYGWEPGCLSFGRNQTARGRYDGVGAARRGYDIVRRPTGGRSVLHHRETTYSVTAPADHWGGLRDAYVLINRALAAGLRGLGIPATMATADGSGPTPRPAVRACFRDPLPGEVTVNGRKLVGSAQWRDRGALLQHGSLLIHNDQDLVEQLRIGGPPVSEVPAVGLAELIDPVPEVAEIADALASALASVNSLPLENESLTPDEESLALDLVGRYEDPAWTWRR